MLLPQQGEGAVAAEPRVSTNTSAANLDTAPSSETAPDTADRGQVGGVWAAETTEPSLTQESPEQPTADGKPERLAVDEGAIALTEEAESLRYGESDAPLSESYSVEASFSTYAPAGDTALDSTAGEPQAPAASNFSSWNLLAPATAEPWVNPLPESTVGETPEQPNPSVEVQESARETPGVETGWDIEVEDAAAIAPWENSESFEEPRLEGGQNFSPEAQEAPTSPELSPIAPTAREPLGETLPDSRWRSPLNPTQPLERIGESVPEASPEDSTETPIVESSGATRKNPNLDSTQAGVEAQSNRLPAEAAGVAEPDINSAIAIEPNGSAARLYQVNPGDTVGEIALQNGISVEDLVQANQIEDPDSIAVNQKIKIPLIEQENSVGEIDTLNPTPETKASENYTTRNGDFGLAQTQSQTQSYPREADNPSLTSYTSSLKLDFTRKPSETIGSPELAAVDSPVAQLSDPGRIGAKSNEQLPGEPIAESTTENVETASDEDRTDYIDSLRADIIKLREKYREQNAQSEHESGIPVAPEASTSDAQTGTGIGGVMSPASESAESTEVQQNRGVLFPDDSSSADRPRESDRGVIFPEVAAESSETTPADSRAVSDNSPQGEAEDPGEVQAHTTPPEAIENRYVENLRAEIEKLREKYRTEQASFDSTADMTPTAATDRDTVAPGDRPGNSVESNPEQNQPTLEAQLARLREKYRSEDRDRAQPNSTGSATATQNNPEQVIAAAPMGAEAYAPLLQPSVGEMVSPDLPPLTDPDNYLPEGQPGFNGYIWPAEGVFTSGYGWRWGRMHRGIDIAGPIGTPIYAAAPGVVTFAGWNSGGYGNLVEIEHPDGSLTLYAHNHRVMVREGQLVEQGEQVAEMGSTGFSTGPHLHFEIHPPGQGAVNPMAYLPAR